MRQFSNTVNNIIRFAAAVFAVCALAAHAQSNPDANSIQSLSISGAAGGTQVITVVLKSALANPPAGFSINTPPRIAFDFPNTSNGLGKSTQDFSNGDLRSANIVQAGNRTRLVINLDQMLSYNTRIEGNTVLITLQAKTGDTATAVAATRFAEAQPAAQKHSLRDVDFHRGKNGEGRIQVDLSDASVGINIKQQGAKLIVDFLQTSLPHNLQQKLDVTDFSTPVEGIDTFVDGDNVRMVIEPKGLWEHAAYQTDNKFIVEVKKVADDPSKLVKGSQSGYAGEKLTLNFQNIAVREALYVISDFINSNDIPMNMVIDDSVSGNITLRLKDVPWDQALDIILNSRELGKIKNGNVIQIAPRAKLAIMERASLTAAQDNEEVQELHTESFQLNFSKAQDIATLLSGGDKNAKGSAEITREANAAGTGNVSSTGSGAAASASGNSSTSVSASYLQGGRLLSNRGSARPDIRTNTVFVTDIQNKLDQIRAIIKKIDVPVRQVMIEARFVNAQTSFSQSLGGKLSYTGPTTANGGGFPVGAGQRGAVAANVNMPASTAYGTATLQLFNAAATKVLNLELTAAEDDGASKNIASPRVVTEDAQKASIATGVQIPYQTTTSLGATTTTFAQANLSLDVTPHITPDDHVEMDVDVNNDTQGAMTTAGPIIDTNKITTKVTVENGGTVVIGGVYTLDETDATSKVPMLGDIPGLGWLFKTRTKTEAKKELLIFITPKVLKDSLNLR
jgi:type IV pilus assembly protein PilQ